MSSVNSVSVLTTLLLVYLLLCFSQHLVVKDGEFYKMEGKVLVGNVTEVKTVQDYMDCSFLCLEVGPLACMSFNVHKTNAGYYICELGNTERYLEPSRIQDRPGYDYYGMESEVSYLFTHLLFIYNTRFL